MISDRHSFVTEESVPGQCPHVSSVEAVDVVAWIKAELVKDPSFVRAVEKAMFESEAP